MYLRYFGVDIYIRIAGLFKFTSCVFILYSSNCFRVLVFCQWICSDRRIVANILLRQGWWNTFTRFKLSEFGTCGTVEKARRQNATGWTKNTGPKYTNTCYTNKKLKINTMSWLTVFLFVRDTQFIERTQRYLILQVCFHIINFFHKMRDK